jgi:hypothetical protein
MDKVKQAAESYAGMWADIFKNPAIVSFIAGANWQSSNQDGEKVLTPSGKLIDKPKGVQWPNYEYKTASNQDGAQDAARNKVQLSNVTDQQGIDLTWLKIWEQFEIWYGDHTKKETGREMLLRIQSEFSTPLPTNQPGEPPKEVWPCRACGCGKYNLPCSQCDGTGYVFPYREGDVIVPAPAPIK